MATRAVEYVVKARDESGAVLRRASAQITGVTSQLGRLSALPGISQATAQLSGFSSALTGLGGAAGPIGLAAGAVVGLATALGASAIRTANQVEQYDRLQQSTGATREQLQVLERVFKDFGASGEDVAPVLQKLNKEIGDGNPLLARLGVTTRNSSEALLQLGEIFDRSSDTAGKQRIAQELLGRSSADLIGVLHGLRGATDETRKAMADAGAIITDKTARSARELDKEMDSLALSWEGALQRIGAATVPWAADMVRDFNRVWDAINGNEVDSIAQIDREIEAVSDQIEKLRKSLNAIASEKPPTGGLLLVSWQADLAAFMSSLERAERTRAGWIAKREALTGVPELIGPPESAAPAASPPLLDGETRESPREKRLKEIQRLLAVGRAEAERYATALDNVAGLAQQAKLARDVLASGVALDDIRRLKLEAMAGPIEMDLELRGPRQLPPLPQPVLPEVNLEKFNELQKQLLESAGKVSEVWADAGLAWESFVARMTEGAAVLNDGLGAVWNGLNSGLNQALQGILTKTMTVLQAIRAMMRAIGQELLALGAKLLASQIMKVLLALLKASIGGGGPVPVFGSIFTGGFGNSLQAAGAGAGGRVGGGGGDRSGPLAAMSPRARETIEFMTRGVVAPARRELPLPRFPQTPRDWARVFPGMPNLGDRGEPQGPRVQQTIYLSGIDSKSLYEEFVSPRGQFRKAEERRARLRLVYG